MSQRRGVSATFAPDEAVERERIEAELEMIGLQDKAESRAAGYRMARSSGLKLA